MQSGCTIYVKGSVEAVEFYQKAFNIMLGYHVKNENGTYAHAELGRRAGDTFGKRGFT